MGSDSDLKGGAKAEPAKLEDWKEAGARMCLVLTYIDKDSEFVINTVDLGELTSFGQFPSSSSSNDVQGEKVMRLTIDPSVYTSELAQEVFDNGIGGFDWNQATYTNPRAKRTILIPIREVGAGGATINWGWNGNNYSCELENVADQRMVEAWEASSNGADFNANTTHLGYDKIVHTYDNDSQRTITITGDALKFGCYSKWADQDYQDAGSSNHTAPEKGWGAWYGLSTHPNLGGMRSFNFSAVFINVFPQKVTFINEFPDWRGCEFISIYIVKHNWMEYRFKILRFTCIGGFVSHIKKLNGEWFSAGFSDFTNGAIGPFDNFEFTEDYSEHLEEFKLEQYKEDEDGIGQRMNYPYESFYHLFLGQKLQSSNTIDGMAAGGYQSTYTIKGYDALLKGDAGIYNGVFSSTKIISNYRLN